MWTVEPIPTTAKNMWSSLLQVKDVLRVSTATPDPRFPKGVPDLKVRILYRAWVSFSRKMYT